MRAGHSKGRGLGAEATAPHPVHERGSALPLTSAPDLSQRLRRADQDLSGRLPAEGAVVIDGTGQHRAAGPLEASGDALDTEELTQMLRELRDLARQSPEAAHRLLGANPAFAARLQHAIGQQQKNGAVKAWMGHTSIG